MPKGLPQQIFLYSSYKLNPLIGKRGGREERKVVGISENNLKDKEYT